MKSLWNLVDRMFRKVCTALVKWADRALRFARLADFSSKADDIEMSGFILFRFKELLHV